MTATSEIPVRRLVLLRHGETAYNATKRMQGQLDTQLSEVGVGQAISVAKHFRRCDPAVTRIVSSDLQRAARTADEIGSALNLQVSRDERLRETNLGVWQARSHAEIDRDHPGMRYRWRHDANWAPEGAETRMEVAARMHAVVTDLLEDGTWPGNTFMLVAHGGAIAALTASLLDVPVSHYTMFNGLKNTAWVELEGKQRDDGSIGWYLGAFNAQVMCP